MESLPSSLSYQEQLKLPDHTQLPESDGRFVKNFLEHPQNILLTDSIQPLLDNRHPDGHYCIGQDSGIYWRLSDPPEKGATAPDWFYVPNVPATLNGQLRRSYVMWKELVPPLIVIEFVSGNDEEERDQTPFSGKFWIYEQVIRPLFYAIYEDHPGQVEVYHLVGDKYRIVTANARGHYSITPLGVELGLWQGRYQNIEGPWLRWWDSEGSLLLTGKERAEIEHQRMERERQHAKWEHQRATIAEQRAEWERQRAKTAEQCAERLRAQLKALGIEPID